MDETLEEVEDLVAEASEIEGGTSTENAAEDNSTNEDGAAPEFAELKNSSNDGSSAVTDMNRLMDVKVTVAVELGKASLAIQDLLALKKGSVIELNRQVDSPVELIAQGVPFGNGEVVIIDEKFAIRIQEIYAKT